MPTIIKRPQALNDLADIWAEIADDSEQRADAFVAMLDGKIRTLAGQPQMGRRRDELAPALRSWPIGRYVVFYLPLTDGVDIVRVLHGARDLEAAFQADD